MKSDFDRKLWDNAYAQGVSQGKKDARHEMLTWLERQYVDRGESSNNPRPQAMLTVARELMNHFKKKWGV